MERQEFKASVMAMIRNSNLEQAIDKAMNCGAIDIANQDPENYATRKALIAAIFEAEADQWRPLTAEGKEEYENLKQFI